MESFIQTNRKTSCALVLASLVAVQGCQSSSMSDISASVTNIKDSAVKAWDDAKQRNAEYKATWYYKDKPLMAPKFKNGKAFNVNGKRDTIDGFRGMKWSSPVIDGMNFVKRDGLLSYYQYTGDLDYKIGGAALADIQFVYLDNRLHSVQLLTNNDTDGQALLSALDVTFGVGIAPDSPSSKPWNGQYTIYNSPFFVHNNVFHYNKHYGWGEYDCGASDEDMCKATLYSKVEEYKHQEAFSEQAHKAAADF